VVGLPLGSGDIIHKRSRGLLYRATCNRMDAVCVHLSMPSIVSRFKTSLPSVITNRLLAPSMADTWVLTVYLREPTCEHEPFLLLSTGHTLLLSAAHLL
jgi:hypothetical protein